MGALIGAVLTECSCICIDTCMRAWDHANIYLAIPQFPNAIHVQDGCKRSETRCTSISVGCVHVDVQFPCSATQPGVRLAQDVCLDARAQLGHRLLCPKVLFTPNFR